MKYIIVSKKRTLKYILTLIFFLLSLVSLLFAIFVFETSRQFTVFLLICFTLSLILLAYVKQHIEIGELEFINNEDFIIRSEILGNHQFVIKDLVQIKLILSSYERKVITGVAFTNEGLTGLGNYIKFIDENRNKFNIEIFIKTETQFNFLMRLKKQLETTG
ncbi:MAG: hypothetical protein ACQETL_09725 [Bacteroidota bacterium]